MVPAREEEGKGVTGSNLRESALQGTKQGEAWRMGSQSLGTMEGYTAQTSSYLSETRDSTPSAVTGSSLEPGNKAGHMLYSTPLPL